MASLSPVLDSVHSPVLLPDKAATPGNSVPREILVVDDSPEVRLLIRFLLEDAGYSVLEAGSAEEGLELFRQRGSRVALLLTDVDMHEMDGIQLASSILKMRSDLPVLFMSGRIPRIACQRAFIAKPFENHELLRRIHERMS